MTKETKRRVGIVGNIVAIIICLSMLLGTTFAWFTDSVTSSGNIIKSGDIDVTMLWAEGTKAVPADAQDWNDASQGAIFNYNNWEPGYTQARHIKIANDGSLALKYKVSIVANGEVSDLADVIDVYYADPAVQVTGRDALTDANKLGTLTQVLANLGESGKGTLVAGEEDTITIALKMQESAGSEYANKQIGSDFAIYLTATQLDSESDDLGNDYDVNAPYILPTGVKADDFGANVAYVNGNFYATLNDALLAIHNSGANESALYLKPNADLGVVNHAHVCSSITVYGNDAFVSGGERDFEIGIPQTVTCTLDSAIVLTINDLDGCAVWGGVPENASVTVVLNGCENVSKVTLPNYTTGNYDLSIEINNCTFLGTDAYRDSAIWCRGLDNLTVTNTTFKNYKKGVNQNNKDGVENYTLTDCTFIDCSTAAFGADADSAPVRAVVTGNGTLTNLTMTNVKYIFTNGQSALYGNELISGNVNVVRN